MKNVLILIAILLTFQSFGQENGWQWQNPKPQGNDLYVFDAQTIITVGEMGTIMKTANGGNNWQNKNSET